MVFTEQEQQELSELLSKAAAPAETLTVDGLHGFLFAMAISPEIVMPNEWPTLIFGREMAVFESRKQADRMLTLLFVVYNRFVKENEAGTLAFPFNIDKMSRTEIQKVREWCLGFTRVLSINPEAWGITEHEKDPTEMSEEEHELSASIGVVTGAAYPDDAHGIFMPSAGGEQEEAGSSELQAKVFFFLPLAVDYIRQHGNRLREEAIRRSKVQTPKSDEKPGRNDPCPCNSGKKYKKCCGA